MDKFDLVNSDGFVIDLVNNNRFKLIDITNLTKASVSASFSESPYVHGDKVSHSKVDYRDMEIILFPTSNVEEFTNYILEYIKPAQEITLRKNNEKRITGTVIEIDEPRFENGITMTISLHCGKPFWEDIKQISTEISHIIDLHYFPIPEGGLAFPVEGVAFGYIDLKRAQVIYNRGAVETGMTIKIIATGKVVNPRISRNADEYLQVNITLSKNEEIVITTHKGNKTITKNGENIIHLIDPYSTWLQLKTGKNEFTISSDDETLTNIYFNIEYKNQYV